MASMQIDVFAILADLELRRDHVEPITEDFVLTDDEDEGGENAN